MTNSFPRWSYFIGVPSRHRNIRFFAFSLALFIWCCYLSLTLQKTLTFGINFSFIGSNVETFPRGLPQPNLRVASWNLRVPFPQDSEINRTWEERRSSVASAIAAWRPHLLALQEDCYFMSDSLMNSSTAIGKLSSTYERYGLFNRNGESFPSSSWPKNAFTNDGMRDGEHNSVWYDKQRFTVKENLTFWLSYAPTVVGSSFDEITGRVANCLLLQDISCSANGAPIRQCKDIFFCSTHLPAGNATKQLLSVDVLNKMFLKYHLKINQNVEGNLVMMISGDFNSVPDSDVHRAMKTAGFIDSRDLSLDMKLIENYTATTNDWYGGADSLIDYIWIYNGDNKDIAQSSVQVQSVSHVPVECCEVDQNSPRGNTTHHDLFKNSDLSSRRMASDHLMVVAGVSL